ncbi:DegQ family serine endoprotease [soil metagenome]
MRFGVMRSLSAALFAASLMTGVALAQTQSLPNDLPNQLPSIADLAEKLLPAVVDISTTQKVEGGGPSLPLPEMSPDVPFRDLFDEWLKRNRPNGGNQAPAPRTVNSLGSGFVIDPQGVIVTNNHVVEQAEEIHVTFTDGTRLKAELVGRDVKTDIAVLRVKPTASLPSVQFGNSDELRVGDWVLAIGNPFGLGGSVSLGIVSARNRDINAGPYDDFIQTDAAINKGNSGGPLFNLSGNVVGVNTAIYSPSGGSVGIGFSVPAVTARGVVDQLIRYGETRRGWLGVRIQSVTDDLADSLNLGKVQGALVAEVTAGGPAEKAGLKARDVIVEFNGRAIHEMKDLPRVVADTEIGKMVTVKVMREGKPVEITAQVGRLEDGEKLVAAATGGDVTGDTAKTLGMTLSIIGDVERKKFNLDPTLKGAIVTAVDADSAAAEKRIEPGDVITEAGQKPVTNPADVAARVKDAESGSKNSVLLFVAKGGKQSEMRFIAVRIKK